VLIDWFTVIAQIVNFLILIWLLNRFLFRPIRAAIDAREKSMAEALGQAKKAEQQARARALELEEKQRALENAHERMMNDARDQVAQWREKAVATIREEVDALRQTFIANVNRDRQAFLEQLKQQLVRQVMHIGEKVLRDLADEQLNRQVLRVFLEKLDSRKAELDDPARRHEIIVRSGVPLEPADTRLVQDRLDHWFPACAGIRFEWSTDLGPGIQLLVGDRKVGWHLADYLGDLETEIMANLFGEARMKP
jgi:F-type H+-transporting ATPase subunit b